MDTPCVCDVMKTIDVLWCDKMTLTILWQAKKKSLSKQQWVISVPERLLSVAERRDDATLWKTGPCPNFFFRTVLLASNFKQTYLSKKKKKMYYL